MPPPAPAPSPMTPSASPTPSPPGASAEAATSTTPTRFDAYSTPPVGVTSISSSHCIAHSALTQPTAPSGHTGPTPTQTSHAQTAHHPVSPRHEHTQTHARARPRHPGTSQEPRPATQAPRHHCRQPTAISTPRTGALETGSLGAGAHTGNPERDSHRTPVPHNTHANTSIGTGTHPHPRTAPKTPHPSQPPPRKKK